MPKKLKLHDNQRVDLEDFDYAASTYTQEHVKSLMRNLVGRGCPAALRGFAVEIHDQSINPGGFSVHNGYGYDRQGNVLVDDESVVSTNDAVLTAANTTYYIEIEYVETDTDPDYRAFWDPAVQNPAPIPSGQEVTTTVATRVSTKWRIVEPSTSGFDIVSNPSSTKVPVAILRTDSDRRITSAVNHFTSLLPPHSTLSADAQSGASQINVFDSAYMLSGDTLTIADPMNPANTTTVSVTGNDVENGRISISPLSGNFPAGSRVWVSSSVSGAIPQFLPKNPNPNDPAVDHIDPAQRINDQLPRLFQGDETRGTGLLWSAQTFGERDDLKVSNLADYVDYLAALIREMKFGNPRSGTVGTTPISVPGPEMRYYDNAGSIAGAKGFTYSIGDGINSFGDYNGTDKAPFEAAIAAMLAHTGFNTGTLFVKKGVYTFSGLELPHSVRIVGEGRYTTIFEHDGVETSMFYARQDALVNFEHVTIRSGSSDLRHAFYGGTDSGPENNVGVQLVDCQLEDVRFFLEGSATGTRGIFAEGCLFSRCRLETTGDSCPISVKDSRFLENSTSSVTRPAVSISGRSTLSIRDSVLRHRGVAQSRTFQVLGDASCVMSGLELDCVPSATTTTHWSPIYIASNGNVEISGVDAYLEVPRSADVYCRVLYVYGGEDTADGTVTIRDGRFEVTGSGDSSNALDRLRTIVIGSQEVPYEGRATISDCSFYSGTGNNRTMELVATATNALVGNIPGAITVSGCSFGGPDRGEGTHHVFIRGGGDLDDSTGNPNPVRSTFTVRDCRFGVRSAAHCVYASGIVGDNEGFRGDLEVSGCTFAGTWTAVAAHSRSCVTVAGHGVGGLEGDKFHGRVSLTGNVVGVDDISHINPDTQVRYHYAFNINNIRGVDISGNDITLKFRDTGVGAHPLRTALVGIRLGGCYQRTVRNNKVFVDVTGARLLSRSVLGNFDMNCIRVATPQLPVWHTANVLDIVNNTLLTDHVGPGPEYEVVAVYILNESTETLNFSGNTIANNYVTSSKGRGRAVQINGVAQTTFTGNHITRHTLSTNVPDDVSTEWEFMIAFEGCARATMTGNVLRDTRRNTIWGTGSGHNGLVATGNVIYIPKDSDGPRWNLGLYTVSGIDKHKSVDQGELLEDLNTCII